MLKLKGLFSSTKPYRVLTIDGGGMRGLYSAILLDTLNRHFSKRNKSDLDIGKGFDLIVGTSTGAIIGILLLLGVPSHDIVKLYRQLGPKIFSDPIPFGFWKLLCWVLRNWTQPADNVEALREGMRPLLGTTTLAEAFEQRGIGLCVPAVNMASHRATIFRTPHYASWKRYIHYSLLDVLVASVSAPMLFPLAMIDDPEDPGDYKTFIDGGLWANNPVLIGLSEALRVTNARRPIEIISISTCSPPEGNFIPKNKVNWGLSQWQMGTRAFSLALEAQSYAYNDLARNLTKYLKVPCKIVRLNQATPSAEQGRHVLMDRATPESLKVLSDLAKQDADSIFRQVIEKQDEDMNLLAHIFAEMPVISHQNS